MRYECNVKHDGKNAVNDCDNAFVGAKWTLCIVAEIEARAFEGPRYSSGCEQFGA